MCQSSLSEPNGKTASTGMTILTRSSISQVTMMPMRKCSGLISMIARMPTACPTPSMLGGGLRMWALRMIAMRGPGSSSRRVPSRLRIVPPSIVPIRMPTPNTQLSILGSQSLVTPSGATSLCGWPSDFFSQLSEGLLGPAMSARL